MSQDPLTHQTAERHSVDETTSLHSAKPAQAVDGDDSLEVARVQALCDLIKVDAERDLTTVEQTLDAAQEDIRKEHERVLELVANQQRLLETEVFKSHQTAERYCADEATALMTHGLPSQSMVTTPSDWRELKPCAIGSSSMLSV